MGERQYGLLASFLVFMDFESCCYYWERANLSALWWSTECMCNLADHIGYSAEVWLYLVRSCINETDNNNNNLFWLYINMVQVGSVKKRKKNRKCYFDKCKEKSDVWETIYGFMKGVELGGVMVTGMSSYLQCRACVWSLTFVLVESILFQLEAYFFFMCVCGCCLKKEKWKWLCTI